MGEIPCPPCHFERILMPSPAALRLGMPGTLRRPAGTYRLLLSMVAPAAARRPHWAVTRFKSSVTGSRRSTLRSRRPGQPEATGQATEVDRRAVGSARRDRRERPHTSQPWRGLPAHHRSVPVGMVGVPRVGQRGHGEQTVAGNGMPQAFGTATPSCASRGRDCGFKKTFPGKLAQIAQQRGRLCPHDRDLVCG
jgi:hypothetical protein